MNKFAITLSAFAALTGSAFAADLPARTYSKAPVMVAPTPSWTGFYIFGGAGGGIWDADSNLNAVGPNLFGFPVGALTRDQRVGGDGYFGTVGAGYDWQFNSSWVGGIFADGQFGSLRGSLQDGIFDIEGTEKLKTSYAAGVRLGYLVAPNVLSYVNGGYSGSEWSSSTLTGVVLLPGGFPGSTTTPSFHRDGVFVGGGVENNLDIFGISAPGWFMKTEYRAAYYGRTSVAETFVPGLGLAGLTGTAITFKPLVETVSTSLVYRFNWGGSVVAKY